MFLFSDMQSEEPDDQARETFRQARGAIIAALKGACLHLVDTEGFTGQNAVEKITADSKPLPKYCPEKRVGAFGVNVQLYHGLLGKPHRTNFVLVRPPWPEPFAADLRVQNTSGTAFQKIDFWFNTAKKCPFRCALILAGSVMDSVAHAHVERLLAESGGKIFVFWSLEQFREWLASGAPYPFAQ